MTNEQYTVAGQLVNLLFEDAVVKKNLLTACTNPQQYIAQNQAALAQRGIERPIPALFWIAVVNGLAANNKLVELDWKQGAGDLYNTVVFLLSKNAQAAAIINKIDEAAVAGHLMIEQAAPHFNKVLNEFNLTLAVFDIDSDSYPVTIIPTKSCTLLQEYIQVLKMGKILVLK